MATVHDVAARIITEQHAAGRTVDKLQLQKLLYLVQGAHVALTARTGFIADFRAYKHGPVVEQVESTYRHASKGSDPIPGPLGGNPDAVTDELAEAVAAVLDRFGDYIGTALEKVTKLPDSPWKRSRGDIPDSDDKARPLIPATDIARWYLTHPLDSNRKNTPEAGSTIYDNVDEFLASLG